MHTPVRASDHVQPSLLKHNSVIRATRNIRTSEKPCFLLFEGGSKACVLIREAGSSTTIWGLGVTRAGLERKARLAGLDISQVTKPSRMPSSLSKLPLLHGESQTSQACVRRQWSNKNIVSGIYYMFNMGYSKRNSNTVMQYGIQ